MGKNEEAFGFYPDRLKQFKTEKQETTDSVLDLFGDASIPVTLIGTSYSANPLWNFHGFLQEALNVDILNAASEGEGPFITMKKYLLDKALETSPPKIIIWEIPERYIPVKYSL